MGTRKGPWIIAIKLEKPVTTMVIPNVEAVEGSKIEFLGSDGEITWRQKWGNIVIEELPEPLPCDYSWSFKIRVIR